MSHFIARAFGDLDQIWNEAIGLWLSGGWAMIAIAVIAMVIFGLGLNLFFQLRRRGFDSVSEDTWREWIEEPSERRGYIGEIIDFASGARSWKESGAYFDQIRAQEMLPFERDLRVMKIFVSAAPLVGLLGTVTGMLATFGALSSGAGGEKTMGLVAAGISEALITTETGLVIAIPGLFLQYHLGRKYERYKAFLAHLETVCTQSLYRRMCAQREIIVQRVARNKIAAELQRRLRRRREVVLTKPTLLATSEVS